MMFTLDVTENFGSIVIKVVDMHSKYHVIKSEVGDGAHFVLANGIIVVTMTARIASTDPLRDIQNQNIGPTRMKFQPYMLPVRHRKHFCSIVSSVVIPSMRRRITFHRRVDGVPIVASLLGSTVEFQTVPIVMKSIIHDNFHDNLD